MSGNAFTFGILPLLDDSGNRLLWKIAASTIVGMGLAGTEWVTDTALHSGNFWAFHALTDCVLAEVNYSPGTASGSPAGAKMLGGDRIYGNIRSLRLVSGTGELYRAGTP